MTDSTFILNVPRIDFDSILLNIDAQSKGINHLSEVIEYASKEEKFWGLFTYDTVFTVIITISIFFTGIVLDRFLKYFDKRSEKRGLVKYFKAMIDRTIEQTCVALSEEYKKYYQNRDIERGLTITPPKASISNFKRIHEINLVSIQKTIKEKEPLSRIISSIDYAEHVIQQVDIYHSTVVAKSNELRDPISELSKQYMHTFQISINSFAEKQYRSEEINKLVNFLEAKMKLFQSKISQTGKITPFVKDIVMETQQYLSKSGLYNKYAFLQQLALQGNEIIDKYFKLRDVTIQYRLEYRRFHKAIDLAIQNVRIEREKIKWPK